MNDQKWINEWERALGNRMILKNPMFLYEISFSDNCSYVGISMNPEKRISQHLSNSGNKNLRAKLSSEAYQLKIHDIIWTKLSLKKEDNLIRKLENSGVILLNMQSGGRFGQRFNSRKSMSLVDIMKIYEKYYAFKNCTY